MLSTFSEKRALWWSALILVLLILLNIETFTEPFLTQTLLWRSDLCIAQPWRLITGFWIHLSWQHALLNLTGLTGLMTLAMQWNHLALLIRIFLPASLLTGALLCLTPLQWYAGLSALLVALTVFITMISRTYQLIILLLLWLIFNPFLWPDHTVAGTQLPVAHIAHTIGFLSGAIMGMLYQILCKWKNTP